MPAGETAARGRGGPARGRAVRREARGPGGRALPHHLGHGPVGHDAVAFGGADGGGGGGGCGAHTFLQRAEIVNPYKSANVALPAAGGDGDGALDDLAWVRPRELAEYLDAELATYLRHLVNFDTPRLDESGRFVDAAPA